MSLSDLLGINQIHISSSADGFEIDIEFRQKRCNELPIVDIKMVKLPDLDKSNDGNDRLMNQKQ